MKKEFINLPNTREWVRCNEDSKAHMWRENFVTMYGGEFKENGKYWQWMEVEESCGCQSKTVIHIYGPRR